jgi:hypothetical protein
MDITQHFKQGYKTTEFWFTIVGALIVLVNAGTGLDLDSESILALAGTVAAYVASRSYLKGHRAEALAIASDPAVIERSDAPPVG